MVVVPRQNDIGRVFRDLKTSSTNACCYDFRVRSVYFEYYFGEISYLKF